MAKALSRREHQREARLGGWWWWSSSVRHKKITYHRNVLPDRLRRAPSVPMPAAAKSPIAKRSPGGSSAKKGSPASAKGSKVSPGTGTLDAL